MSFIYILFVVSDIDECSNETHGCDVNAECNNTQGTYICRCKDGFQGSGISCTGKYLFENLWSFQLACITQRNRGDMLCVDEIAK